MAVEARIPAVTVLMKGPETAWTAVGGDPLAQGVTVEGLTCSVNEAGPDTCSFTLRRRADLPYPDLQAFSSVEVWVGGTLVWGGRVWEAPLSDTGEESIAVQCRGWQYHLDDDVLQRMYVHTRMSDYRDQRSFATADISGVAGGQRAGPTVVAGDGAMQLIFPTGYLAVNNEQVVATFDAGASLLRRAVVTWERIGINDADDSVRSRGAQNENAASAVGIDDSTSALTSASGTISHTFSADRRYHHVMLTRNGATMGGGFGADQGVKITAVKVFGSASYESGGASILTADTVVRDVLASGALPQMNPDTGMIEAASFQIPDFAPDGYRTPREILAAVNAYENRLLGVDARGRLFYRARPTIPNVEIGAWAGSSFTDASANTGEQLFNRVIVQGSGPDGAPVSVPVVSDATALSRIENLQRTALFSVSAAITSTAAGQIGALWLAEKERPPMKGTVTVAGPSGARNVAGGPVQPVRMLLEAGNVMRISHLIDPYTGALARDATIRSVTYDHASDTATVELDNERGRLETLLERLAVVTTQVLR